MLVWIYYNPNDAQRKEIQFALIHSVAMCFCHIQKKASPLCEIEGWSCIKVFRFVGVVKNVVFLLDLEQQLVLQSDSSKTDKSFLFWAVSIVSYREDLPFSAGLNHSKEQMPMLRACQTATLLSSSITTSGY